MRNMYPDADYFAFLDEMRDAGEMSTVMAPVGQTSLHRTHSGRQ